jgi:hypothetical protein
MTFTEIITALVSGGGVAAVIGLWLARAAVTRAWLRAFLDRFREIREAVVLEVEQTYVDRILKARAPTSPGGAELTPEEQAEALRTAVGRLKELVGLAALERALKLMGLPRTPAFVDQWLATWVEATVKRLSIEQAVANAAAPARIAEGVAAGVHRASAQLPSVPRSGP